MIVTYNQLLDMNFKKKFNLSKKTKLYKEFIKNKKKHKNKFVSKYAGTDICKNYIERICKDKRNKLWCYSLDPDYDFNTIPCIIIHRKTIASSKKLRYIILIIATIPSMRNYGYGNISLSEYVNKIRKPKKKVEIILHSLEKAKFFYINFGFKQIQKNNFISFYEGNDDDKILLKYTINNN